MMHHMHPHHHQVAVVNLVPVAMSQKEPAAAAAAVVLLVHPQTTTTITVTPHPDQEQLVAQVVHLLVLDPAHRCPVPDYPVMLVGDEYCVQVHGVVHPHPSLWAVVQSYRRNLFRRI